jgi:hypothetical protein
MFLGYPERWDWAWLWAWKRGSDEGEEGERQRSTGARRVRANHAILNALSACLQQLLYSRERCI